jgi:hypothetical protein
LLLISSPGARPEISIRADRPSILVPSLMPASASLTECRSSAEAPQRSISEVTAR